MDVDAALGVVGGYRRWHLLVFCLLSISSFIPMVFHSISIVFIGWTPPHHCALNENQTKEEWIPKKEDGTYESCLKYTNPTTSNNTVPCDDWYYYDDGYSTMVTEFDLVCDGNYLSDVSQTLLMAASCITDCVASYFTDRFGRRNVHIAMQYSMCILGLCVTFTPNYIAMTITRILVGMVTTVVINSGLTMMTEFFDSKRRTFAGIGLEFGWLVVYFMPLPLAYFIKDWRVFMFIASVLPLIFIIYHWNAAKSLLGKFASKNKDCDILPESASWLVAYNRYDEAEAVLDRIGRYNGLHIPPIHLTRPWEEQAAEMTMKVENKLPDDIQQDKHHQVQNRDKYDTPTYPKHKTYPNQNGTKTELDRIEARQLLVHDEPKSEVIGEKLADINRKSYYQNGNGQEHFLSAGGSKEVNGKAHVSEKSVEASQTLPSKQGRVPVTLLIKDPKLRLHLLMANMFWFGNTIVYYGLILNAPNYGDRFLTYLLMGLAEIPAYIVALFVVDKFGRRLSMSVFFLLAGITLTVTVFIPKDTGAGRWCVMCLVIFARFAISGSFAIMVLYLRELFPTDVRSSSVAWCGVGGGIGAVSAPILAYVGKVKPWLPNLTFGLISIIVTTGIIPLPETTDKPLPSNLRELYEIYYPSQQKKKRELLEQT